MKCAKVKSPKIPKKTYIVGLTTEERNQLKRMINVDKTAAYKQRHARILLLTDQNYKAAVMKDDDISKELKVDWRFNTTDTWIKLKKSIITRVTEH